VFPRILFNSVARVGIKRVSKMNYVSVI